jgi:putative phosphoesterase
MAGEKLLILSDTHGNISALKAVLNWAKTRVPPNDTITTAVFLGDGVSDLQRAADTTGFSCEWKLIKGNNDHGYSMPEAAVFDFCGYRFFMCHGHRYAIYNSYDVLIAAARNTDANVALFGHTHVPSLNRERGLILLNPGSVGSPRSRLGASFAVIECSEDRPLEAVFWGISGRGEIRELKVS